MKLDSDDKKQQGNIIYPKVTTWDVVKEYWKSAKFHWFLGLIMLAGWIIATLAQSIIIPIYYKQFFDVLAKADPSSNDTFTILTSIIFTILLINAAVWIGFRMAGFGQNYFLVKVGKRILDRGFGYLIRHSFTFFSSNFSGAIVQRVNRFHQSFSRIIDTLYGDVVPMTVRIVAATIVLYFIHPIVSYALIFWILIFITISFVLAKIKLKYDIQGALANSRLTGVISDSISNHSSTQLFTGYEEESRLLDIANKKFQKILLFRWNFGSVIDGAQSVLTVAMEFVVFYYGIKYWQLGIISLGTFVLVQAYIISIGGDLWRFGRVIRNLYEATADAKEMVEILHLPHEIQDIPDATALKVPQGLIEFKDVSFAFGENKPVFNKLNLHIKAGEKVALIGSSGAGKSTLVKLLLRLNDLQGGEISIDGQNIKNVTQESLRENISLVPQDPALFHRTLMENIRYGKRDATEEEVISASKLAHCDIFIKDFPYKYETFVGERGIKLSGGERQRVAIARALLKNAPILVLDEATSSLDSHSESLIQDALQTLMKGKTTLVIAHRLSTIRKMDRIIVLGKDGILEEGSHEQLIQKHGMYARLWNLQAGGFADKSIEELLES
jgi:ATP-binding cassette subfamily B protein